MCQKSTEDVMIIYAFYQEGSTAHWISRYLKGIKEEAKRKNNEVKVIECGLDSSLFPEGIETTGTAIVISGTYNWTRGICSLLANRGIKAVVIGYDSTDDISATGYVLMDYKKAIYDLLDYYISCGRKRVALFAVSLESPADKIKTEAFLSYRGRGGERFEQKDIFYFRGMTRSTCESFISVCSDYDAVIGTNDVSTVILLQMLGASGIKVPDDIFVAAFGDTYLSKSTTGELTLSLLDCKSVGVQAVKMNRQLANSNNISSVVLKLACETDIRASTANIPMSRLRSAIHSDKDGTAHSSFFADPHVSEIVLAEQLLGKCDSLDLEIMRSLINKEKYIDIADKLHVSENTVKYRIKRLLTFAKLESRTALTDLMKGYLS